LSIRQFVRPAWLVPLALLALVFLPGCEDQYNENMIFPVRTDPVVLQDHINDLLVAFGEVPEPDRPGQLPLMRLKDYHDPRNPFFDLYGDSNKRAKLEKYLFDPITLSSERRSELEAVLKDVFGIPARPRFDAQMANVKEASLKALRLDEETLREGGARYRIHCMQCHGLTGDGRGPTSKWVNPHPRDYRPGVFKFQSVDQSAGTERKPRRADLFRTIKQGVEGTTMPAHNMLPDREIDAMVSYVIFLSIRGQAELGAMEKIKAFLDKTEEEKKQPLDLRSYLLGKASKGGRVAGIVRDWAEAQNPDLVIRPSPYKYNRASPEPEEQRRLAESVRRGFSLYQVNCGACHKDFGRQAPYKLDSAGWAILLRPANLTMGVYRGGRRPIDLYWRVHSGINGSGMAKFGEPGGPLAPDQIWDVVNFLQALPYPAMQRQHGIRVN
jgi:mono/diheme cytochrome c family protein